MVCEKVPYSVEDTATVRTEVFIMNIFEAIMLLCFGSAWPFSIYRSYKSRSVQGKSLTFLIILIVGYIAGILNKLINHYDYVLYLYILNMIMVSIDTLLYIRNLKYIRNKKLNENM